MLGRLYIQKAAWGTWLAQSVKHLTLAFSSGHEFMGCEYEPQSGICADSSESAWDFLSLSISLPLHSCSLSLSLKINKNFQYKQIKIKSCLPKIPRGRNQNGFQGRGGGMNGELLFNGYRVTVWDQENVLETDSRAGCTTL